MKADLSPAPAHAADPWTILAITVVVCAMGSLLHEGLGHGGACLLTGGHPLQLTTVYFNCSRDTRLVDAGGTLIDFATGLIAFLALRRWPSSPLHLRFFFWLTMAFTLMDAAGYFLFSGVSNFGDWAQFIQGLSPVWAWRAALVLIGVVLYALVVWLAARELRPLLPSDNLIPVARRFCYLPYFAGGLVACIAGSFNPQGMFLVAVSAAAATFGGHIGMVYLPLMLRRGAAWFPNHPPSAAPLQRNLPWLIAGSLVALLFIFVLGPGITF